MTADRRAGDVAGFSRLLVAMNSFPNKLRPRRALASAPPVKLGTTSGKTPCARAECSC
jgi:hypothetical protein